MTGLAGMALNTAPIFGGVLLAVAAGQLKGPDYRGTIKQDLDLLDRLPPEQTARRAALQRTIEQRIDDLIEANDRSRELQAASGKKRRTRCLKPSAMSCTATPTIGETGIG